MATNNVLILLAFFFILTTITALQVPFNLKYPTTQTGFVLPNRGNFRQNVTYVLEGVDVLLYLAKVPDNIISCQLTTPGLEFTYSLERDANDESTNIEFWSPNMSEKECGARIKNISLSGNGRWRLQAKNDAEIQYQSFLNLRVFPNTKKENEQISIRDGASYELNLIDYAGYCTVSNKTLGGEFDIYDNCQIDIENANKALDGKWMTNVGVLGKIDEVIIEPNVTVLEEQFDVGFEHDKEKSKYNLYCNVKNPKINTSFSFCRFLRDGNKTGLSLSEGLSNGFYSYYGKTLREGYCGLTIEKPTPEDFKVWTCSVGIYRTSVFDMKQAIISLTSDTRALRTTDIEEGDEILGGMGHPLNIMCNSKSRLKYCTITHPNGTIFPINEKFGNENWTTKALLDKGECEMTILIASQNETGEWSCQKATYDSYVDEVTKMTVRIADTALVANKPELKASEGSELTIKCTNTAQIKKLEYCRFTLPTGAGFRLDETVTAGKSIDDLYYYGGTSLENGDCTVVIREIKSYHFGKWICAGKIVGAKESLEAHDNIEVEEDKDGLSLASIVGIAGGVVIVMATGGAFICYRRKKTANDRYDTSSHGSEEEVFTQEHIDDPIYTLEGGLPREQIEMTEIRTIPTVSTTEQSSGPSSQEAEQSESSRF